MLQVSVVIINKNDLGIISTIDALISQQFNKKFEIVIVDSSDERMDAAKRRYPKIKWINFKSASSKKITIPEQRNVGVNSARGKVIVFIDANCIPVNDWLSKITEPIFEQKEMIVAGRVGSTGGKTLHDNIHTKQKGNLYFADAPTINLAIDRRVFTDVGLFDEKFDYGSDTDFSWRISLHGYKIRYCPDALIRHDWGTFRQDMKRAYNYGQACGRLTSKYFNTNPQILIKKLLSLYFYCFYLITLPIIIFYPVYILLLPILALKNIKNSPMHLLAFHFVRAAGAIAYTLNLVKRLN